MKKNIDQKKPSKKICKIVVQSVDEQGIRNFLFVEEDDGKICLPGGLKKEGEIFQNTAKRKLFEETGIKINTNLLVKMPIKFMRVFSITIDMKKHTTLISKQKGTKKSMWIPTNQIFLTKRMKSSHRKIIKDILLGEN